jgi:hypothetical protein
MERNVRENELSNVNLANSNYVLAGMDEEKVDQTI